MLQQMYIIIALISYLILLHDLFSGLYKRRVLQFVMMLCGILLLFVITMLLYDNIPRSFTTSVLYFGSTCIAGAVCGIHLAIKQPWEQVDRLLPYFLAFVGIAVGIFGMRTLLIGMLNSNEGAALDYQTVSYYMAEIFALSGYYAFFSQGGGVSYFRIARWVAFALMLFAVAIVLISGGRGGFLYMCISAIVIVMMLVSSKKIHRSYFILVLALSCVAFLFLASNLSIFESSGFDRITSTLTEDDNRKELYGKAWSSFTDAPITGHGLGSVWMEVGFYSHNVFLDLLVELGVFGMLAFIYVTFRSMAKLWLWKKYEPFYILILLSMLKGIVMVLFSGYWLNTIQLWMFWGFVYITTVSRNGNHKVLR